VTHSKIHAAGALYKITKVQCAYNNIQHTVYFNLAAIGWIHITCTQ